MKPLNVLSLFDGMSCGMLALERAGVPVNKYYSSEIDKYAIQVSESNYPEIIRLGNVTEVSGVFFDVDLLIGGSPCQGFSFAGKQLNFEDPRSKLFFEYVRILNEIRLVNPGVKFLLENVRMKKESQDVITGLLGVEPIEINSALVSAQNRRRLYWTNIPGVSQPEDKGILLNDIIDNSISDREKSHCLDANYYKKGTLSNYFDKRRRQIVFPAPIVGRRINDIGIREDYNKNIPVTQCLQVKHSSYKCGCLTTVQKDNVLTTLPPGRYVDVYNNSAIYYRHLTPIECERLQTVPDNYTACVSDTQRYKILGNGWTVEVIAHIFKNLLSC